MDIKKAEFIKSVALNGAVVFDELKQIAFVGRSNVGKSSLINYLVNNKNMARTSSTPGRTRLLNYFKINNEFYFVDLPGYGFNKAGKLESNNWQEMIEPYLTNNFNLKGVVVLVDFVVKPSPLDMDMVNFLNYYQIPFIIVATKCDKISKAKRYSQKIKIANSLKIGVDNLIMVSSDEKFGKEELLNKIKMLLSIGE